MNRFYTPALAILTCLLTVRCAGPKIANAPKPPESYNRYEDTPLLSYLTIPVLITVDDLVSSLNKTTSGEALYEDFSYTDNNNDGLMLSIWKSRDISLSFYGNTIKYRIPLKIWVKKDLLFGAAAEADGELALNFKTTYKLNPDWTIATQTEVEWHEWLTRPALKTGLGSISVETIANVALNRSKRAIAQALDEYVSEEINLRPYVQSAWNAVQEPVLLDEQYQMWTKTTPLSISMTPIQTVGNAIQAKIAIECMNDVTFGKEPSFRPNSVLPGLTLVDDVPDEFTMQFAAEVPFPEAERLAREAMTGQTFESGKNKVKIEDVRLWGSDDKVVVNTRLSGSLNGDIYFIGKPEFNPADNSLEVKDLDFHVDTKNTLLRSASWLFKGPIRKKMAAAMTFPLAGNIGAVRSSAQQALTNYEIQPGILLNGTLDSIGVQQVRVTPAGIRADLFSKGKVGVDVKGL
ncbi:MAG: DUF4403 family protein [Bacteroidota bacterium]